MKNAGPEIEDISYYCFNKVCTHSVYNVDLVKVTHLPISLAVLSEHQCDACGSELISLLDIEIKNAVLN